MTEIYKLARPLLRGVKVEILGTYPRMIVNGKPQSINNQMVKEILGGLPNLTGELVVGNPIDPECQQNSLDFINSPHSINLFVFWTYDAKTNTPMNLRERLKYVESMVHTCGVNVQYVDHELVESHEAIEKYRQKVIDENFFPGIVLREPFGTYGTEDTIIEAAESRSLN